MTLSAWTPAQFRGETPRELELRSDVADLVDAGEVASVCLAQGAIVGGHFLQLGVQLCVFRLDSVRLSLCLLNLLENTRELVSQRR
eukprot:m.111171 g.111171  ORF g.111171 m.111171 type:complete len:86 (+) comp9082_c0_seq1:1271-1528(+)